MITNNNGHFYNALPVRTVKSVRNNNGHFYNALPVRTVKSIRNNNDISTTLYLSEQLRV